MLACRLLGHRLRFRAEGRVMRWSCERCLGAGGEKTYGDPGAAARFAAAFDRDDVRTLGRRAPLFGLFPLRAWHWFARRRSEAGRPE